MSDFDAAIQQFRQAYDNLFALTAHYPPILAEQSGACGVWSPKQVLAHLSGWIEKADERYDDFDRGDTRSIYFYDVVDVINGQSVESRAHLTWQETVNDLRRSAEDFAARAECLPRDQVDLRHQEWLVGMANDCREHLTQLQTFLEAHGEVALYPILEFDPTPDAIIDPHRVLQRIEIPERAVLCFFQEVILQVCGDGKAKFVTHLGSEMGQNPVYEIEFDGKRVAVVHPGVGAPLAGAFLDELIALGCTKFVAAGGAGVLNREMALGHVVVPSSAVRDEGTSYHYLPPSREVGANADGITAIEATLQHHHVPYVVGKTWTTDAIYRETRARMERRKAEGCITVEMEAAAFFAVAQFRGVQFAQLLYSGDNLDGDEWDNRGWQHHLSSREKLFWLAVESCTRL